MSNNEENNNSHDINSFDLKDNEKSGENENEENQNTNNISNSPNEEEHNKKDEISEIFRLNVNEAMAKKSLIPSITLIVSIESNPNQEDSFWNDDSVLDVLNSNFIVVRLSQTKNVIEILQFSSIFIIKTVPSLFVFGPFSQGISYAWPDRYPTPSEFVHYVQNQLFNKNSNLANNFSDLVDNHAANQNQPAMNQSNNQSNASQSSISAAPNCQPVQSNISNSNSFGSTTGNSNSNMNSNANLSNSMNLFDDNSNSNMNSNANLSNSLNSNVNLGNNVNSFDGNQNKNMNSNANLSNSLNSNANLSNNASSFDANSNNKKQPIKKSPSSAARKANARISVRVNGQSTNFEFPRESLVEDVVAAIESKYGTSYELYVPHLHRCINFTPEELKKNLVVADLAPSAIIILRGPDDPGFTSNIHRSDGYEKNNFDVDKNEDDAPYIPPPSNSDKQFTSNAGENVPPSLDIEEDLPTLGHTDTREVVPSDANDADDADDADEDEQRRTRNNRCGLNFFKKILSVLNPWGDVEEVEDFFEVKEFRT